MPAEHAGPFEQFAGSDHTVKSRLIAEAIMHAFDFTGTRQARGDADRKPQVGLARQQCIGDRRLAGARGGGQHQADRRAVAMEVI